MHILLYLQRHRVFKQIFLRHVTGDAQVINGILNLYVIIKKKCLKNDNCLKIWNLIVSKNLLIFTKYRETKLLTAALETPGGPHSVIFFFISANSTFLFFPKSVKYFSYSSKCNFCNLKQKCTSVSVFFKYMVNNLFSSETKHISSLPNKI